MPTLNEQKLEVEIELLRAQTNKANKDVKWYEVIVFISLGGVLVAAGTLIGKM